MSVKTMDALEILICSRAKMHIELTVIYGLAHIHTRKGKPAAATTQATLSD